MQSLKSKIDALWLEFHSGGITNPITVIEQISYLMFIRLLDLNESRQESRAQRLGKDFSGVFGPDQQHLRWKNFKQIGGDPMLKTVRDEVFPFLRDDVVKKSPLGKYLENANCLIPTGNLLVKAVNAINELPLDKGDTKGDLYEYLLSKLQSAGIAGQFRTPRHIIRAMVEILDPKPTDTVCDPACGTAGFLVGVMDYLKQKYSTPALIETDEDGEKHYPGDLLEPYREHIQNSMFFGFDFDSTMLRIAAMNLLLHDVQSRTLHNQDTLVSSFSERMPQIANNHFDVILANPPFKGSIDADSTDPTLKSKVKTKKTELLFLVLMLRMLNNGGRCAVIVPDGVLFGSSGAHVGVRKMIVDDNQLEAVISLPSGVFKPYAGVSTAILVFTKGGRTDDVWFYDVLADGYSLDDKRTPQPDKDDLPDLLKQWNQGQPIAQKTRTKNFKVPVAEIRDNKYDLSINRYKEVAYEEVEYEDPKVILGQLKTLEQDILKDIEALEGMLD
ncbi:class I SAM-dependent DNA methyltransferase [Coraliomargarita sp. SDUM461004]|uniref:site-specific DNA-methyltransferase (adenine-specific) n=1 Tax=Thalassobacterium sedimentorum TaxID=3041258 RepID=A0ABU1AKD9_9BACT|nr:class I SAM-dependent DNA methyltransferase [Coraliomargarita sp. SDUM461004]MDQ8195124.1 class I SAM-dependent DNA methyltransferase [Coraliomargarita sp. SDUM461004]